MTLDQKERLKVFVWKLQNNMPLSAEETQELLLILAEICIEVGE